MSITMCGKPVVNTPCPYQCSYKASSGYCGLTGGIDTCQYHNLHNYEIRQETPILKMMVNPSTIPKQTNFDRIGSMSIKELAAWFEHFASCELCPASRERCGYGNGCIEAWLDWLKEKVIE